MTPGATARLLALLLLLGGLAPLACAAPQRAGRVRALAEVARELQEGIRWKSWEQLERWLDPSLRPTLDELMARGALLSFSEVELLRVEPTSEAADEGLIRLDLRWLLLPSICDRKDGMRAPSATRRGDSRLGVMRVRGSSGGVVAHPKMPICQVFDTFRQCHEIAQVITKKYFVCAGSAAPSGHGARGGATNASVWLDIPRTTLLVAAHHEFRHCPASGFR
jgi:hypothetical protein